MKKILIQITPPFIYNIIELLFSIKSSVTSKKTLKIDTHIINVPPEFPLENYQYNNLLYDRFLPILVKNLKQDGIIVDIGANIGDTLFSIFNNCKNQIICVEPSDIYFDYLYNNYNILSLEERKRVELVKKMIGSGTYSGELKHEHGTAHIELNDVKAKEFISLSDLLSNYNNINLIKVDTDGFDFDVLISGEDILAKHKPILFWENYIDNDFQKNGFEMLYELLTRNEYDQIYIFDNFGNILTFTNSFSTLTDINEYLYNQLKFSCTRTFYYTDILAATKNNKDLINNAVREYKNYINNK